MTIRIDRIDVNRDGPLDEDFEFEPGDLNLIYGRNETGKTYVVESLIKFLFKTKSGAPVAAGLRDWKFGGRAVVSGLGGDPVSFNKSGEKLEDRWVLNPALPPDFARLLVVRAGETALAGEPDGVGRDILKEYVLGEDLFRGIQEGIPKVVRVATVKERLIDGKNQGKISDRNLSSAFLSDLQSLLDEVEEGYANGDAFSLQQKRNALFAELETLGHAKQFRAGQLAAQIDEMKRQRRSLPGEADLASIKSDMATIGTNKATMEATAEELGELEGTVDDFRWAKAARGIYDDAISKSVSSGSKPIFILLALLSLIGTVVLGRLGLDTWLLVSAAAAVAFVAIYYLGSSRALADTRKIAELDKLMEAYKERFDSELTDRATLQAKFEELEKSQHHAEFLRNPLRELSNETQSMERKVTATLTSWTGIEVQVSEWREVTRELSEEIARIDEEIELLSRKLRSIGVPENQFLDEDPGVEWAPVHFNDLTEKLRLADEALRTQEANLERLKIRVSEKTIRPNADWEELITELRKIREMAAGEYKQITADILAMIQVQAVISKLALEEDTQIASGLRRPELTELLHALTGRYRSIRLDDDRGLVLVTDKDEDFPLADMSTGAREQVFLALRMGFASIAMEGTTGFLILDDAFQHSDWDRRKRLVDQTLRFVQRGWQVFYFTMDDNIRDLFRDAGASLGDRFEECELG